MDSLPRPKSFVPWLLSGSFGLLLVAWLSGTFVEQIKDGIIGHAMPVIKFAEALFSWHVTDSSNSSVKWDYLAFIMVVLWALVIFVAQVAVAGVKMAVEARAKFLGREYVREPAPLTFADAPNREFDIANSLTSLSSEFAVTLEKLETRALPENEKKYATEDFMVHVVKTIAKCFRLDESEYRAMWIAPAPSQGKRRQVNVYSVVGVGRVGYFSAKDLEIADKVLERRGNPVIIDSIRDIYGTDVEYGIGIKNKGPKLHLGLVLLILKPQAVTPETEIAFRAIATNLFWLGHIPQFRKSVLKYVREGVDWCGKGT